MQVQIALRAYKVLETQLDFFWLIASLRALRVTLPLNRVQDEVYLLRCCGSDPCWLCLCTDVPSPGNLPNAWYVIIHQQLVNTG
jgi:hypothetical protein